MRTEQVNHFILGFGAGIAAAILLAPRAGFKTRALIAKSTREGEALLRQKGVELSDAATETIERGKKAAKVTAEGIVDAVAAGKKILMNEQSDFAPS